MAIHLSQASSAIPRGQGSAPRPQNDHASPPLHENTSVPPIAVVGMALRLPGGIRSPESLWDLVMNKSDSRSCIPADRFNVNAFHASNGKPGDVGPQHGYFLEEPLGLFDAGFFTMSKAEVAELDPQQRLLLEVVWECMENAAQKNWKGQQIGCYVGVFGEDWLDLYSKDTQLHGMYRTTGTGDFVLANRVSYEYDLKGPSMTIRTGCSSALVGLHEACEAIYNGHCTSAIVAGTNLIISPTMTQAMTMQGVLSPSGSCKTFDADADGYGRGEAINAIYVKRLDDALRDGDPIRAVIRATASNCDGKTAGMSNPSPEAHETMMRLAYQRAKLHAPDTAYVECHGTGTPVGDPLETTAIGNVFGGHGVYIGSVKPNVGHSEGASGITSLIKTVLALEHQMIPPNINFSTPNPKIPFKQANLKVPVEPIPWPMDKEQRAGVNSFGIGGSNVHVILDSAASYLGNTFNRELEAVNNSRSTLLIPLSANSEDSLKRRVARYQAYLANHADVMIDLTYTLSNKRDHLSHRAYAIAGDSGQLQFTDTVKSSRHDPELIFVFTGQGAQWAGMSVELLKTVPAFRADIHRLDQVLQAYVKDMDWNMESELLKSSDESRLDSAEFSQPLCTALQIALVNLLRSWGIHPSGVVGHSSGEIAAAYAAQAISAETAMVIAYHRGQVTKASRLPGAMAAVGMSPEQVKSFLKPGVVIACENSSRSITISGDADALHEVVCAIKEAHPELLCRKLRVTTAYHSHHMRMIGKEYETLMLPHVSSQAPAIPFYSSVQGEPMSSADLFLPPYWRSNLEEPVRFCSAVTSILSIKSEHRVFVEIGPHSTLAGPLRQIFQDRGSKSTGYMSYIPTLVRNEDQVHCVLKAAGSLFQNGVALDFSAINGPGKTLTNLPPYEWQHDTSYWRESRVSRDWRLRTHSHHELLGSRTLESANIEPSWRNVLDLQYVSWLRDHKIGEDIVFPAAGYVAMLGEAIRQITGSTNYAVRELVVKNALMIHDTQSLEILTTSKRIKLTDTLESGWYEFAIMSYDNNSWTTHCTGQARADPVPQHTDIPAPSYKRMVRASNWYSIMRDLGLNYGPHFRGLQDIKAHSTENKAGAITQRPGFDQIQKYAAHPIVIDQILQLFTVAMSNGLARRLQKLAIPSYIGEIHIAEGGASYRIDVEAQVTQRGAVHGHAVANWKGKPVITINKASFTPLEADDKGSEESDGMAAVRLEWQPKIDFLDQSQLLCCPVSRRDSVLLIEKVALLCMIETAHRLQATLSDKDHLEKFKHWLFMESKKINNGDYKETVPEADMWTNLSSDARLQLLQTALSTASRDPISSKVIPVIQKVFENAISIMKGEVDSLDLLMEDQGLAAIYDCCQEMIDITPYFRLLGHSRPTLRILEIGAGTGGITSQVLSALHTSEQDRMYAEYSYTDISSGFFSDAKERFKEYDGITYSVLDVTKDPVEQGFEPETFDFIIASNVLHATPNLKQTLANVRKLLIPGGQLFLQELSIHMRWINYIMGVLPGWWLGAADDREYEPFVQPDRWRKELRDAGFSGIDTLVYDDQQPFQINAHMISTASKSSKESSCQIGLLYHTKICPQAHAVAQYLEMAGFTIAWYGLDHLPDHEEKIISLLDLERPLLYEIAECDFIALQKFLNHCASQSTSIIWVTRSAQIKCQDPRYGLVPGFTRTIRSELSLDLATFETDQLSPKFYAALCKLCKQFPNVRENDEMNVDYEYAFFNGSVHTPRFHWISSNGPEIENSEVVEPAHLQVGTYGALDSLAWIQEKSKAELVADEVEVEIRSVGMNFRDVLVAMGIIDNGHGRLGLEGSGIVRRVGPDVDDLRVGDRVFIIDGGCFGTEMITSNKLCVQIPDGLTFEQAATMPCVYSTVIHALIDIGRLEEGQSVLIHSACGGVGLAAIQVCRMAGAEIFATVGSEEKIRYLVEVMGISRDHIFNSRDATFLPDLMRVTRGQGADLVLNSLSGELLHASWQCVAKYGKMLEIGKRDFIGHGMLSMDVFQANRSFVGIDLADLGRERPSQCHRLLKKCLEYYAQGHIQPLSIAKVFQAAKTSDAFRYMQQGQHIGKIVIDIPEVRKEFRILPAPRDVKFKTDSAYLLVGGLGGLGRAVATWMVEKGARTLIFLSRSAGKSKQDQEFLEDLECQGCKAIAVVGSATSFDDILRATRVASKPIAGVIQMSMVLRDGNFADMTYDDWKTALSSKVDGTWSIHKAFADVDLDFLLLFSSISGIVGQWGQSNYAAANTFLDSFVQYRHSQDLVASVIDVGVMKDVGYVSENAAVLDVIRSNSTRMVGEADLLEAVSMAILRSQSSAQSAPGYCNRSQISIGMALTKAIDDPANRSVWKRDLRMAMYRNRQIRTASSNGNTEAALKEFLNSVAADPEILDEPQSISILTDEIGKRIKSLIFSSDDQLDPTRKLSDIGVDSLVSIEIRNWWRRALGLEISVLEILNEGSIERLAHAAREGLRSKHLEKFGPHPGLSMKAP